MTNCSGVAGSGDGAGQLSVPGRRPTTVLAVGPHGGCLVFFSLVSFSLSLLFGPLQTEILSREGR